MIYPVDSVIQPLNNWGQTNNYRSLSSIKYFRSRAIGLSTSRDQIFLSENWEIPEIIIHQIVLLTRDWPKRVTWPNIRAKTGEYPRIFPNFQNYARCEKDLKDNKDNSRHLGQKYARIFVLGHYLFRVAHSFPRALLSENCSLLGTDNVRGQISEHIFAPNGDYCLFSIYQTSE